MNEIREVERDVTDQFGLREVYDLNNSSLMEQTVIDLTEIIITIRVWFQPESKWGIDISCLTYLKVK